MWLSSLFNDSKATNPHAAAAGLKGVDSPMILIGGGYEKGLSLEPFITEALGEAHHFERSNVDEDRRGYSGSRTHLSRS